MFCKNCGREVSKDKRFCMNCGHEAANGSVGSHIPIEPHDEKWWLRLLKVGYILLYIPFLIIVAVVWSENSTSYEGYSYGNYHYVDTYGTAFWCSLLAVIIGMVIIRLIKIAVLYIVIGQKPLWKREFKRLY